MGNSNNMTLEITREKRVSERVGPKPDFIKTYDQYEFDPLFTEILTDESKKIARIRLDKLAVNGLYPKSTLALLEFICEKKMGAVKCKLGNTKEYYCEFKYLDQMRDWVMKLNNFNKELYIIALIPRSV